MRWYIYHQIGCTSSWCCWSRPDTDDKSKEIFLLSFLALVKLDAGWARSGIGARFLGFMSSPCVWRKPAASAEEPCTPERGGVCRAYPNLGGCARAGTALPPTRRADHRLLQQVICHLEACCAVWTWRESPVSMETMDSSSSSRTLVELLAGALQGDTFPHSGLACSLICASTENLPFKLLF